MGYRGHHLQFRGGCPHTHPFRHPLQGLPSAFTAGEGAGEHGAQAEEDRAEMPAHRGLTMQEP